MPSVNSTGVDKLILSMQRAELEQVAHALSVLEVFYEQPEEVSEFSEVDIHEMLETLFSFNRICAMILDGECNRR